jgi:hypothetical protein
MKILSFFLFILVIFALLDPDPDPTAQINADPCGSGSGYGSGSETLVKILKFFDADPGWKKFGSGMETIRIRDGNNSDPGWKKVVSGIRDKHPGSATLLATHTSAYAPSPLLSQQ